jgi:GNAT superfamily N-acetyltransferase
MESGMYTPMLVTDLSELMQIADLSRENLKFHLSDEEKKFQGFITWEYSFELLKQMHEIAPSVIVKHNDQVVGYALTAFKETAAVQPELVTMIEHLETLSFKDKSLASYAYYIMGQVCIAKAHRGKGIFEMLYRQHKNIFCSRFELLITEVSTSNHRSIQAHRKVGFQTINTYRDMLDEWDVVVWDLGGNIEERM